MQLRDHGKLRICSWFRALSYPTVPLLLGLLWAGALPGDDVSPDEQRSARVLADHAIAVARDQIAAARANGNLWLSTPRLLEAALAKREAQAFAEALALAERAARHAELALAQAQLERARYRVSSITAAVDPETLAALRGMIRARDGAGALQLLDTLETP